MQFGGQCPQMIRASGRWESSHHWALSVTSLQFTALYRTGRVQRCTDHCRPIRLEGSAAWCSAQRIKISMIAGGNHTTTNSPLKYNLNFCIQKNSRGAGRSGSYLYSDYSSRVTRAYIQLAAMPAHSPPMVWLTMALPVSSWHFRLSIMATWVLR